MKRPYLLPSWPSFLLRKVRMRDWDAPKLKGFHLCPVSPVTPLFSTVSCFVLQHHAHDVDLVISREARQQAAAIAVQTFIANTFTADISQHFLEWWHKRNILADHSLMFSVKKGKPEMQKKYSVWPKTRPTFCLVVRVGWKRYRFNSVKSTCPSLSLL